MVRLFLALLFFNSGHVLNKCYQPAADPLGIAMAFDMSPNKPQLARLDNCDNPDKKINLTSDSVRQLPVLCKTPLLKIDDRWKRRVYVADRGTRPKVTRAWHNATMQFIVASPGCITSCDRTNSDRRPERRAALQQWHSLKAEIRRENLVHLGFGASDFSNDNA